MRSHSAGTTGRSLATSLWYAARSSGEREQTCSHETTKRVTKIGDLPACGGKARAAHATVSNRDSERFQAHSRSTYLLRLARSKVETRRLRFSFRLLLLLLRHRPCLDVTDDRVQRAHLARRRLRSDALLAAAGASTHRCVLDGICVVDADTRSALRTTAGGERRRGMNLGGTRGANRRLHRHHDGERKVLLRQSMRRWRCPENADGTKLRAHATHGSAAAAPRRRRTVRPRASPGARPLLMLF